MRCMIMAAGLGTRLAPLTASVPKPMVPIVGRPALEHIIRLLAEHEVREAVVNLHHLPEGITGYFGDGGPWGVALRYSFEEELLGTAGGVKSNQGFLEDETFLVMSGDALTDVDLGALVDAHRRRGSIATLAVSEVDDPSEYGVLVVDDDDRVVGFQEKPPPAEALSRLCNCGMYVFEPAIFERIPAGCFYDFGRQVLPGLVADGVPFHVHRIEGYWSDVGSLPEYRRGNLDALSGAVRVSLPGSVVSAGVRLGVDTRVEEGAHLVPPVLLGDGCVVSAGASLRGPVVLGARCTVAPGALVEASVLWDDVEVGRDARLVDTVAASGAKVGAGVSARRVVLGGGCGVGDGVVLTDRVVEPGARV